jgi:hypothetical protein
MSNIQGNPLFSANLKQRRQLYRLLDLMLFESFVAPYSSCAPLQNWPKIGLKVGSKIGPKLAQNWPKIGSKLA